MHIAVCYEKRPLGDSPMNEPIIVVDGDKRSCRDMCNLLEGHQYCGIRCHALANIQGLIEQNSCRALILDLDTVPVDNRRVRNLKKANPGLCVLAVSGRIFHPELKEAIASYIYACLCKPVDPDELIYLVKSIFCNATNSEENPVEKGTEDFSFTAQ